MGNLRCYDIFLTHAWRFHDDWSKFSKLLDGSPGITWRNFSLPWHDPAIKMSTESGRRFIRDFLEGQIIPVHCVVLLTGVHEINSARRWLDVEVEIARKYNKPLIGVPAFGAKTVSGEIGSLCDACCEWDAMQLVTTIDQVRNLPKYSCSS